MDVDIINLMTLRYGNIPRANVISEGGGAPTLHI